MPLISCLSHSLPTPGVNLISLKVQANKQPEDTPSYFIDEDDNSLIDGEQAYHDV
jgi:hypothetical protein